MKEPEYIKARAINAKIKMQYHKAKEEEKHQQCLFCKKLITLEVGDKTYHQCKMLGSKYPNSTSIRLNHTCYFFRKEETK